MNTRVTDLLGIRVPVIQGAMARIADGKLAGAVSAAGGLGIIACGGAPLAWIEAQVRIAREIAGDAPLGANVMLMDPQAPQVAELLIKLRVDVVTTGAGSPANFMAAWKEAGIKVVPVVASSALAARMERMGADAVVAEGCEAGGHIGELTTMALVPSVCDAVRIPVIAAGGIADGRGMAAAFALGAEGVQMGTRFVTTEECDADPAFKQTYLDAKPQDIEIIKSPVGMPGRAIHSSFLDRVKEGLKRPKNCPFDCIKTCDVTHSPYCIMLALYNAFKGKLQNGYAFCGANAWRAEKIQSVRDLMAALRDEYDNFSLKEKLFGAR